MLPINIMTIRLLFGISLAFAGILKPQQSGDFHSNRSTLAEKSSAPSQNVSVKSNDLEVYCDAKLGSPLDKASCAMAFSRIGLNASFHSFGWRHKGQYDVPLPLRFMSCTSSLCVQLLLMVLDGHS